jgi:lipopolysaccharide biosynthesis regulator YciM
MMKLAIVFLPIVFAVIWVLFIGLKVNKTDENKKLINY